MGVPLNQMSAFLDEKLEFWNLIQGISLAIFSRTLFNGGSQLGPVDDSYG